MKYYVSLFLWAFLGIILSTLAFNELSTNNIIENIIGLSILFVYSVVSYYYFYYIFKK